LSENVKPEEKPAETPEKRPRGRPKKTETPPVLAEKSKELDGNGPKAEKSEEKPSEISKSIASSSKDSDKSEKSKRKYTRHKPIEKYERPEKSKKPKKSGISTGTVVLIFVLLGGVVVGIYLLKNRVAQESGPNPENWNLDTFTG
jgi:cobalamin biosynthesis Mg chelatase CobN